MAMQSALLRHPPATFDPPEARELRERLVEKLVAEGDVRSTPVRSAMLSVPRHAFVLPDEPLVLAYANAPLPIGYRQTISQPTVVAAMTEALELTGRERVLEIGTGCGYQAAILSLLAAEVFSVEVIPALATGARSRLARLGYRNVRVLLGDGYAGWPEQAPFDRVILTAAPEALPPAPVAQLADGGILVAPVGPSTVQKLVCARKIGGKLSLVDLGRVAFVPMAHKIPAAD